MIDEKLLEILRCPQDRSSLSAANSDVIARVNSGIAAGHLVNVTGQTVKKSIDGGLVREAGDLMYPVVDGIPVMLPDEAIELAQVAD